MIKTNNKTDQKLRVVIDTNVWISGLVFGGRPGEILQLFVDDRVQVVISEELISELRRKILQKFPLFTPKFKLLGASLRLDAEMVRLGNQIVRISRDPNDNMFIETALAGACDFIISGDKDLLVLKHVQHIRIVTPNEFLELFQGRTLETRNT